MVGQLGRASAGLAGLAMVALVAVSPLLVSRVFHGDWGLFAALIASVAGYGGACLVRGALAGQRRLAGYGVLVGVDGLFRLAGCLLLVTVGVATARPYGLALGFGSVAAFLVGLLWWRPGRPGPRLSWPTVLGPIGWLVAAWGRPRPGQPGPGDRDRVAAAGCAAGGVFAFAFVGGPGTGVCPARPAGHPASGAVAGGRDRDLALLRRGCREAMIVVGGLGAIALVTTGPLCQWLLRVVFVRPPAVSMLTLTLLAIGTILAMVIRVLQPAPIAVAGHRLVAGAWLADAAAFGACFALPVDPDHRGHPGPGTGWPGHHHRRGHRPDPAHARIHPGCPALTPGSVRWCWPTWPTRSCPQRAGLAGVRGASTST